MSKSGGFGGAVSDDTQNDPPSDGRSYDSGTRSSVRGGAGGVGTNCGTSSSSSDVELGLGKEDGSEYSGSDQDSSLLRYSNMLFSRLQITECSTERRKKGSMISLKEKEKCGNTGRQRTMTSDSALSAQYSSKGGASPSRSRGSHGRSSPSPSSSSSSSSHVVTSMIRKGLQEDSRVMIRMSLISLYIPRSFKEESRYVR